MSPGERAMLKIKRLRTADCVVGGFRYGSNTNLVGSLLLGLYNETNLLDHVGFTSSIADRDRPKLTTRLQNLIEPPGFTGESPGGPSRWSTERTAEWQPLRPVLVVEVRYDHVTGQTDFAMALQSSGGVRTRLRRNAGWISCATEFHQDVRSKEYLNDGSPQYGTQSFTRDTSGLGKLLH